MAQNFPERSVYRGLKNHVSLAFDKSSARRMPRHGSGRPTTRADSRALASIEVARCPPAACFKFRWLRCLQDQSWKAALKTYDCIGAVLPACVEHERRGFAYEGRGHAAAMRFALAAVILAFVATDATAAERLPTFPKRT